MQGLPGSGKTTKAKEILKTDGNAVRINRDSLREMLHDGKWSGSKEKRTKDAARELAVMFLKDGVNVIIDDTNLNEGTIQSWKDLVKDLAKVECVKMDTPLEECIERDAKREKKVGKAVILEMAMMAGIWRPELLENNIVEGLFKGRDKFNLFNLLVNKFSSLVNNEKLLENVIDESNILMTKKLIIVDVDGTIADCEHRKHHLLGEKKDWDSFYAGIEQDQPRWEIMKQVDEYRKKGHPIVLVSGRPDNYRKATENWLCKYGFDFDVLLMRKAGDKRPDTDVKKEIYDKCLKKYAIECVFDDRPRIISMWREQGLRVFDVGKQIEF